MSRPSSALMLLLLAPAIASAQPRKPKVVEEERDGKKVRVMLLSPGDSVTAGDVKYTFDPITHDPGKSMCLDFWVTNSLKTRPVKTAEVLIAGRFLTVTDDNDRVYKATRTNGPGGDEIDPSEKASYRVAYPAPYKAAGVKVVTAEMLARADGADVWRIIYPRAGWKISKP